MSRVKLPFKWFPRFRSWPLPRQVGIGLGTVGLLVCLLFSSAIWIFDQQTIDGRIQTASETDAQVIGQLCIDALISEDRPALQTIVDGLKGMENGLVGIEIDNEDGNRLASWEDRPAGGRIVSASRTVSLYEQTFGQITLNWNRAFFADPAFDRMKKWIASLLAATAFLTAVVTLYVKWYFVAPLQYLDRKLKAVASEQSLPDKPRDFLAKELRTLDRSLDRTARILSERAQKETELVRERGKVRAAEATAKAKMDFLSLMSHEIRTPLGAMLGFSKLLHTADLDETNRSYVQRIDESGEYLLRIINDILDLSKIEAGGIQLEKKPFCLKETLKGLDSRLRPAVEEKGLSFVLEQADGPQSLVGDEHRLVQVLTNLVANSVKFTHSGTVTVRAESLEVDSETHCVKFVVADTGIGMTSEQAALVFDPFSQADVSVTREFGGTGLGLTISKDFIEKMGGSIDIETAPDQGTTLSFCLHFPIADQAMASVGPEDLAKSESLGRRPESEELSSLKILIAEDLEVNRAMVKATLKRLGYQAEFAEDGQACLDRLKSDTFDVIILDLRMPKVDGLTIARKIRSGGLGKDLTDIPLAVMSADILAKSECEEIGINAFISKPIDVGSLSEFLDESKLTLAA